MSYDKKLVTPSFLDALKQVGKTPEEIEEMSTMAPDTHKNTAKKPEGSKVKKPTEPVVAAEENESSEEILTEEQIFEALEQELGPHIAYLLDEGFSEEEVENIIVDMLSEEQDEDEGKEQLN